MRELRMPATYRMKNIFYSFAIQLIFKQIKLNPMKNILHVFITVLLFTAFNGCTKPSGIPATCSNSVKDGDEIEIDCGGSCSPCPEAAAITCNLNAFSFVGISANTYGEYLGSSIRINSYSSASGYLNFMFLPHDLNVPTQLTTGSFIYSGESYVMGVNGSGVSDTGTVIITARDTLRKIMSGTFSFSARRTTGSSAATAKSGLFTNVRYH